MAAIVRYVNVNSTAGGDGTTNTTTGVNRAYVSQNEMEAAEQTDLVAAGDTFTGICSGGLDNVTVLYSGWTTGANNDILITTTDDRHVGVFDTSKYYMDPGQSPQTILQISEDFVSAIGLQFQRQSIAVSSVARGCIRVNNVGAGVIHVDGNIFKSIAQNTAGVVGAFKADDSSPAYTFNNNIVYDFDGDTHEAVNGVGASAAIEIYNNTFINNTAAIDSRSSYLCKNNIFQNNGSDIIGSLNASNDYNLTDNVSIPGVNSVANSVLIFEDKAADNYALVSGDTDAIGAGIGPSADANVPTTDVIGTARSGATTDIGAFVFVGGGGGVTLAVTEVLSSFADSSVINIDYNVSAIITEVLQPFSDSSLVTIAPKVSITATVTETLNSFSDNSVITIVEAGNVTLNVTETLNPFEDSSIINISANVGVLVTEVLNSFLDSSNVTIAKDIAVTVTEVLNAFSDNSSVRMPTNWVDKQVSVTSYTTQTPVSTVWTNKG